MKADHLGIVADICIGWILITICRAGRQAFISRSALSLALSTPLPANFPPIGSLLGPPQKHEQEINDDEGPNIDEPYSELDEYMKQPGVEVGLSGACQPMGTDHLALHPEDPRSRFPVEWRRAIWSLEREKALLFGECRSGTFLVLTAPADVQITLGAGGEESHQQAQSREDRLGTIANMHSNVDSRPETTQCQEDS